MTTVAKAWVPCQTGRVKALVFLPLLLLGAWWVARALVARPVAKADLRAAVGLLTALYLLATAGLGLFWVARMELPVFDWHYLVGYALLLAAFWHLWLELPLLLAAGRRLFGRAAQPNPVVLPAGKRRVPRVVFWILAGGTCGATLWLLFWRQPGGLGLPHQPTPPPTRALPAGTAPPQVVPTGTFPAPQPGTPPPRDTIHYLLRESAASAAGLVRRGLFFGPKVPSLRQVPRSELVFLPKPAPSGARSLQESLLWIGSEARPRRTTPTLEELSTLLFAAAGVTEVRSFGGERLYLRAAPSAGALYPVEVYFATTGLQDLPPGVYVYVPQEHALRSVVPRFPRNLWEALRGQVAEDQVHLVYLTGVFQRTVWKYGSRSYRYVVLDAGHVAANLLLAAASQSWPLALYPCFADLEAERMLQVNPEEEGVLAVASLGESPKAPQVFPSFTEHGVPPPWEGRELTRLSHALTRWEWTPGPPWVWTPRLEFAGPGQGATADVLSLIARRRSFRRFSLQPLPANTVESVAKLAQASLGLVPGGEGVSLWAVVVREEGLPSGVYRFHSETGRLRMVRPGNFGEQLYRAGLSQELLARAAAAFLFTLDGDRLAAYGNRGLRLGLFAAGVAGEVVYLAAGERDLGACGVGAFLDGGMAALVQGENSWPVYLVAVGRK